MVTRQHLLYVVVGKIKLGMQPLYQIEVRCIFGPMDTISTLECKALIFFSFFLFFFSNGDGRNKLLLFFLSSNL